MASVILNVQDLPEPITFKSHKPNKGGNKATVKKMVVADPGVGIEIELETDYSNVQEVIIVFNLGTHEGQYHHEASLVLPNYEGTVDLSNPIVFVAPFIDIKYNTESLETLYYDICVIYYTFSPPHPREELIRFNTAGAIPSADVYHEGKRFTSNQSGTSTVNPSNTDITYSHVDFNILGTALEIEFPSEEHVPGIENIPSCEIILYRHNSQGHETTAGHINLVAKMGKFDLGGKNFAFIPYVPISNPESSPSSLLVQTAVPVDCTNNRYPDSKPVHPPVNSTSNNIIIDVT